MYVRMYVCVTVCMSLISIF